MAQFEVYRNPNRKTREAYPFLVDVQNPVIDQLASRLVVPLTEHRGKQSLLMTKLTPEIHVDGKTYLFLTPQLASVPESLLQHPVGSLEHSRTLLIDAIDFAITGI